MVETDETKLKQSLKKRLEMELGLSLTPQLVKQVERDFNDNIILIQNFPIIGVVNLKIGDTILSEEEYLLVEDEGIIYLDKKYNGLLYLEYSHALPKNEYEPLLDLMMEYELDNSIHKNASSISEKSVSVSYDTNLNKGAIIQSMIQDLKNRYACVVEMI